MFLSDNVPITFNLPETLDSADIFFIHDLHFGSGLFDAKKWKRLKDAILQNQRAYVCWIGDLCENAIPNSKSDMFTQTHSPAEQKEWVTEQLVHLAPRTIVVVPGNHCNNRTTKFSGMYPLYDACQIAGISDKYRHGIGFVDIAIGRKGKNKQWHYFGQVQHKAKDTKNIHSADYTDGIDFFAFGHDHEAKDKPRAKLVFDKHNKTIYKQNVETINCGSFCQYGGYGVENAYRPQSDKMYKLLISGTEKRTATLGFYP